MRLENDGVLMKKNEYMINVLGNGIAIQLLEKYTGTPAKLWTNEIRKLANNQYEILLRDEPDLIDQTIYSQVNNSSEEIAFTIMNQQ